ncbi:PAPA-1 domain-containing protein [Pyrenophora tritici-repentis]|nr:PAPA-1 domain-containing protein [Pyrenophora tritici-repentis]KAI0604514.1 PAPA-1 domain-containing protein [Pyrenophora tritici-repentis]KAI0618381.1 PAPA-1 domain-containing protein [Pyrenophora tritici-repentis]
MPRLRSRAAPQALTAPSAVPTASSTRPRRGTANQSPAAAVIQRSSPEETRQSIHLTVKSSPNKLRQATGGAAPKAGVSRQNIVAGKRASRSSRVAQDRVEAKEMAMDDDDDDDLSDPDSDLEEEDAEGEDEDAEGEEDDEMGVAPGGDMDEDMDSDEDLSRDQTPDVSKMTKRQRALVTEEGDGTLLALSNEAQKKKHLTAEEHAMRRAEMARRRKNLSEKRNEEEKLDTINRLLKKQPPKRGRKALQDEDGQEEEPEPERANPLFVRYIQNAKGTQLAVPDEWLQAPVGNLFTGDLQKGAQKPFSGRMVEEVA